VAGRKGKRARREGRKQGGRLKEEEEERTSREEGY
jgi:hypothetical protein